MRFEWDETKNRRNVAKHKVSFETAQLVFEDPNAMSIQDRDMNGEERWQTLGIIGNGIVLLVAHTYGEQGDEVVRIISARKATARERQAYETGHKKSN